LGAAVRKEAAAKIMTEEAPARQRPQSPDLQLRVADQASPWAEAL